MNYRHCCVIDAAGKYKTFVLVVNQEDPVTHEVKGVVQGYALLEGESLVDVNPPTMRTVAGTEGFICPVWTADAAGWVEAATAEEIAAWEAEHPAPVPTEEEVRAERDRLLSATDWTQVLDAPISAESRAAMRVYRQALRNVPQQSGFPAAVEWPVMPTVVPAEPDPVDEAFDVLTGEEAT